MNEPTQELPDKPVALVARHFEMSPERLFAAWTDPDLIGTWMFGAGVRDEEIVALATDPRPGGTYSFKVRRGTKLIDHHGTYRDVAPPRLIVFSWAVTIDGHTDAPTRVTVEIAPESHGSHLTLEHELDPAWAHFKAEAEAGWRSMLEALAAHVK